MHIDGVPKGDVLQYIHQMLANLQNMARSSDFMMLAYLIEMANIESADLLKSDLESD